jgi:enamidase
MSRIIVTTCLFGLLASSTACGGQADVIFVGANVLTGDSSQPTAEAVALTGERIRAVGSSTEVRRLAGPKTQIVDLPGRTIIPGLMDAHVHLLVGPLTIVDESSLRTYERTALPRVMSGFISHGITTVRSTADPLPYITQLRDRLERGEIMGPRLLVTGPTPTSPGGHPATTVCRNNPFCRQGLAREPSNEEQARRIVRELADAKVDAVKVTLENSRGFANVPLPSDAIVAALVDEAHRSGLRIIAHIGTDPDTGFFLTERFGGVGFDEFVHMPDVRTPSEASRLATVLAGRKMAVTTTVSIWDAYRDSSGSERLVWGLPYVPGMRKVFDAQLVTTRVFAEAGVRLVVGTDWVADSDFFREDDVRLNDPRVQPGARTLYEMDLLRRAGLSTTAILAAATRNAADALGIGDKVGTLAEGKLADLVILDGDLLRDFSALRRTVAVLKGGRVVHGMLPER